ncbi:MAG: hypothetical protein IKZ87_01670 [Actinomycetaceae bacterium]|nr:hypothetical protein [Actinomycetaceae bacterium]
MSYPTYYAMLPEADWPVSIELRGIAAKLVDAADRERECEGEGRKARLEAELAFIEKATHVVLLQAASVSTEPETLVQLAEEIGTMLGEQAYDGTDPEPAWTWAGEALEMAGVGGAAERDQFDDDDAEQMVFVPQEAFDAVLHEVEGKLRDLLHRAKEIIEREPLIA